MKKSSSKSYYNLRPKFRLIPGSSQKKSATSQQIVEDYCDQCVREGNDQISCEICLQENADTTNTSNPPEGEIENQEPLNTDQSESPSILQALNTLSENPATIPRPTAERTDTSSESSHSSDTEESEESLYEDTPLTSVTKRPRKLFQNEKEGSSDHLEYDDFIPDYSTDRSSSEENIADFDDEMDASTLQGLQQTIIELQ